jgi:hypothetical protein
LSGHRKKCEHIGISKLNNETHLIANINEVAGISDPGYNCNYRLNFVIDVYYGAAVTKTAADGVVPTGFVATTRKYQFCRAMFPVVKVNMVGPTFPDPATAPQLVALH